MGDFNNGCEDLHVYLEENLENKYVSLIHRKLSIPKIANSRCNFKTTLPRKKIEPSIVTMAIIMADIHM